MKDKKSKSLFCLVIIILICAFLIYKGYYLIIYRPENISDKNYNEYMDSFQLHNSIVINKKSIENSNYLIFKNVKIRNDFADYIVTYESETNKIYRLVDENENVKAVFRIGVDNSIIDDVLDEALFDREDKEKFLKENNITDDMDLLDFVLQKHKVKNNILTSIKKIKEHAMIQYFTYTTLSNPSFITKFSGDYEGYLIGNEKSSQENTKYNNINTVNLIKDNKVYSFGFWLSDDFTEDYIKDIIETVIIEDEYINSFTKTYQVLDITPIPNENKSYLKLKQFQEENEVVVEVYNSFTIDIEKNRYYEFTFQNINSNVEDNIKSIFENTNLISVNATDKEGLNQIQDTLN